MSIKVRSSLLSLVIVSVLIFSAIAPTVVYADGGTSTDTPPTETTSKSKKTADNAGTCKSLDSSKVSSADSSKCKWATDSGSTVDGSNAGGEATPSPILTEVPENTTVTVLNAEGQSQPLTTQGAADAIATSDPIWCPVVNGVATPPGGVGCTQSFASFNLLLTFLSGPGNATYQGAGTIYVQQGAYNGGESSINFNNYNLSNISNADLTITGGWNISNNTVDNTTTSNFTIPILIGTSSLNPWGGSLTINNINISNTSGTGLILFAQDDISLDNVTVTNSANGAGAELHAGQNPDINNSHDVNISNSHFERNRTAGAIIRAPAGNVTIGNSSFSNPANARRQSTGLDIESSGSVSLQNVLADQNRDVGAKIVAGGSVSIGVTVGSPIGTSSFSGTKNMVGSNFFGYGLQVNTPGAIAIDGVAANDNFLWGASLTGGNVTISNSTFNANTTASPGFIDDTGLLVTSSGTVNIDHIEANDNRLIGATITAAGDVSINNSFFTNNNGVTVDSAGTQTFHGTGLEVKSGNATTVGNITLTGVTASNNTLFGAHLEANGDVTILASDFSNQTSGSATDQTGRGLEVISGGTVFLDTVTINSNQTFGANIQAASDIFLDNVTATGNGQTGVQVQGTCTTLFLINGTYTNNGQYGLSVINAALNQSGSPIFGGNLAGDIFQDPGTCIFPATPSTPPTTPGIPSAPMTSQPGSNVLTNTVSYAVLGDSFSSDLAVRSSDRVSGNLGKVTLNSFLANPRLANDSHVSIFTGKYAYIYSSSGMQIVALSSSPDAIAMSRPFRAY